MSSSKTLVAVVSSAALALGGAAAAPAPVAAQTFHVSAFDVPADGQLVLRGHGYGHGNGMSQYGAEGAGRAGKSYGQILRFYYPGTDFRRVRGRIRVLISGDYTSDLRVSPTSGLKVRDLGDGATWQLPTRPGITMWRIRPAPDVVQFFKDGRWHAWASPSGRTRLKGDGEFFADGPVRLWLSPGVSRSYRGHLRAASPYAGAAVRDTVNVVSMDKYVRGVVPYEMPSSWSAPALKAQSIAARSYATYERSLNRDRHYQTCDTTSCQVYGGTGAETESTNSAVRATADRILKYRGRPAITQFSSSSGGYTNSGGLRYLPAQPDPWDDWSGNGVHDWSSTVDADRVERLYPRLGRLVAVRVTQRTGDGQWGGRVLRLVLDGSQDDVTLSGTDFRFSLGLRSTWFTFER